MVMHRDLRRVTRIRVVANAITDVFERNRQILRYGSHKESAPQRWASRKCALTP
jgi:hypothetical protein